MRKILVSGACVLALSGVPIPTFAADPAASQPQLSCEEQYLNLQENYASLLSGNATIQRKFLQQQQQLQQLQAETGKAKAPEASPAATPPATPPETPPSEPAK